MMTSQQIENLIIRFLNRQATASELDFLNQWIKDSDNQQIFKEFVEAHYSITIALSDVNLKELQEELLNKIKGEKPKSKVRHLYFVLRYAAVVAVLLAVGYQFYKSSNTNTNTEPNPIQKEDAIVLRLSDGRVQTLPSGSATEIQEVFSAVTVDGNKQELAYSKVDNPEELLYNTLLVPYGRNFSLKLSDGTQVQLNSGSSLKYPVAFLKGQERTVFLEGEAYFDVTKDPKHQFVVKTQNIDVRVYGTQFNVKSYVGETSEDVVLVEGSVGMGASDTSENEMALEPGELGSYHLQQQTLTNQKVDISAHIGWRTGKLQFRNAPFSVLANTLQRQYNVSLVNTNEKINNIRFNASFNRNTESIEDVMYYFSKIYNVEYDISENTVTIR